MINIIKQNLIVLVTITFSLVFAQDNFSDEASNGTVSGVVVDASSGKAIAGG